ncbi:molybdopterin molybdotransferase [Sphaerotilus hippei]|uniref:Molybdopterin molybdenumtransferase n=2 Tax=Sphaerotilus hippei TaxID=744406 RepID=A0A318H8J1_9BURK|nr:molybdopterin molybdotransferase [Sphaerotilus hippei]
MPSDMNTSPPMNPTPAMPPEPAVPTRAPMRPFDEALQQLLAAAGSPRGRPAESVSTFDALGRVLAAEVVSQVDVPPADNSAMDGIAVVAPEGLAAGTVLPVRQRIAAGQVGRALAPGEAARLFTGAHLPAGADAVVMQEECEFLADPAGTDAAGLGAVRLRAEVRPGQWVRRRGEDVAAGAVVLPAGHRLDAASLGLAASVGAAQLQVARRVRVALFSTGDELLMPGEPLRPGAIYNSNRYTLRGLLQGLGCEVQDLGIVPDRLDATRAALREAARHSDLILTSGGVSVGDEDHVKPAVRAEGRLDLWQIAMKPGKPLAFGAVRRAPGEGEGEGGEGEAWFLGLPGNPVASCVTFLLLVRPFILRMQGATALAPRRFLLPAAFRREVGDRRRDFVRARLDADGRLVLHDNQGSGVLTSMAWADGLVDLAPGQTVEPGDLLPFLPLSELT